MNRAQFGVETAQPVSAVQEVTEPEKLGSSGGKGAYRRQHLDCWVLLPTEPGQVATRRNHLQGGATCPGFPRTSVLLKLNSKKLNRVTVQPSNSTRYKSKGDGNVHPHENLSTHIHSSITHVQQPHSGKDSHVRQRMEKQNVVYLQDGLLFSHKKE